MNLIETTQNVQNRIYRIRGQQVMLDVDLAALYGVPTKQLNRAVRRNLIRFPGDFMFVLTAVEAANLRFQFGTSSWGGRRFLPYAFTEEGIAMLSSILKGQKAALVNIAIMRAFVKLRHAMLAHQGIAKRVEKLEGKVEMHETDIRLLIQDVDKLKKRPGSEGPINPVIL
jgi:hypothetical protein